MPSQALAPTLHPCTLLRVSRSYTPCSAGPTTKHRHFLPQVGWPLKWRHHNSEVTQNFRGLIRALHLLLWVTLASCPSPAGVSVSSSGKWENSKTFTRFLWDSAERVFVWCLVQSWCSLSICYYYHSQVRKSKWYIGMNRGWGWRAGWERAGDEHSQPGLPNGALTYSLWVEGATAKS